MEFNEKLRTLRNQRGFTQEELAERLFVSRTAISKWESGRGYPNIDSLKAISKLFSVSIDDLLSGEEVLTIAEEDHKQKTTHLRDLVFGLLDVSTVLFFILPYFAQEEGVTVRSVSLLALTGIQPYLRAAYFAVVIGMVTLGILMLALQNCSYTLWIHNKYRLTLSLNVVAVILFIISRQPYAAVYTLLFLILKSLMLLKQR